MLEYDVLHFVDKSATKCARIRKQGDAVRKSVPECEIVRHSTELVWKVWKNIGNGYWLVIIIKKYCKSKDFYILFGFDYFDVGVSICLWRRLLTLVVGTVSAMLADGAKQAGLVIVISQSRI